ncbi:MAG: cysteine rich repeat-containing protein [Pseudomonadota bacterium]
MTINILRFSAQLSLFSLVFLLPIAPVSAQQSVAEVIGAECKQELAQYCDSVTPSRGRIAACLMAHNDKLSEQCEIAFEAGLLQLSIILNTVNYVVEQCHADIDEYCDGVPVGGGRIAQCLTKSMDKLQPDCKEAFSQAKEDLQ